MQTETYACQTFNASVDWLTCTGSTPSAESTLWALGDRLLDRSELEGEKPSRWHSNGYSGWTGPGVAFGKRPDGVVLRLSGAQAAKQWFEATSACENLSRLDMTVDTKFDPPVTEVARDIYGSVGHRPSRNGRPPKTTLWMGSDGGQTVYIGARVSENFGRVYDKGIESETAPAGEWWRWEVEAKGDTALSAGKALLLAEDPMRSLHSHVASWFAQRCGYVFPDVSMRCFYKECQQPSTNEKRLSWLATSVRPSIGKLVEAGLLKEVLAALGLPPQSAVKGHELTHVPEGAQWLQQ